MRFGGRKAYFCVSFHSVSCLGELHLPPAVEAGESASLSPETETSWTDLKRLKGCQVLPGSPPHGTTEALRGGEQGQSNSASAVLFSVRATNVIYDKC